MKVMSIECKMCGLRLQKNKTMYVTDVLGNRHECLHPLEGHMIWDVLKPELNWLQRKITDTPFSLFDIFNIKHGLTLFQKFLGFKDVRVMIAERTGIYSNFYCRACQSQIELDPKQDEMVCIKCLSPDIVMSKDLVGKNCPKCAEGVITERCIGIS